MRIVSLVPSLTELLVDLGLDRELVGITKFCVHPESVYRTRTRVGGTKNVDIDKVRSLDPTLIVSSKEENVKEQVEDLQRDFPVLFTDIKDLNSALNSIKEIGIRCGKEKESIEMSISILREFGSLNPLESKVRALYLIWKDPYMSVGGDTFIHDMMARCGLQNVMAGHRRYPEVDPTVELDVDLVLLSSEPYPFKEHHIEELKSQFPQSRALLVDGEYFSWYGSRLLSAPKYFSELISRV